MEVYIDPEVLEDSPRIHATIVTRIVAKWKTESHTKRGPQEKWIDVVELENVRYVLNFRNESEDKCVVTKCRRAHISKP